MTLLGFVRRAWEQAHYLPLRALRPAVLSTTLLFLLAPAVQPAAAGSVLPGATIHVNASDSSATDNGNCSLREAILSANDHSAHDACAAGTAGLDKIVFDFTVPTNVYADASPLTISEPVEIDGLYNNSPVPALYYNDSAIGGTGLVFAPGSAGSTVRGLMIINFNHGVELAGGKVTLEHNWIGNSDGLTPYPNTIGIDVLSAGNVIGGPELTPNVISGNTTGIMVEPGAANTVIQNNTIGLNAAGASALPNVTGIADHGVKTLIGGTKPYQGNVISGNTAAGVTLSAGSVGAKVQRNYIGMSRNGINAIANEVGILSYASQGALIGGPMPSATNFISGNTTGIDIQDLGATPKTMVTVAGNIIGFNGSAGTLSNSTGIRFTLNTAPIKAKVANNLIANSSAAGLNVSSAYAPKLSGSTNNCIAANAVGFNYNPTLVTTTFKGNWWGHTSGPSGVYGGSGDSVSSSLLAALPALKKPPASCQGWATPLLSPKANSFSDKKNAVTLLKWRSMPGVITHQWVVGPTSNPSDNAYGGVVTGVDYTALGPLDYGVYFWHVTTWVDGRVYWPGTRQKFYVTIQKSPKPDTQMKTGKVKLVWGKYANATNYDVTLYSGADCGSMINSLGGINALTTTFTGLASGPYSWQVKPDNGSTMPCWNFSVK